MENLKDDILKNLESIVEKTSNLENHNGQIPQIELDIILAEIQQLYEKYKKLSRFNEHKENNVEQNNKIEEIIARSEETLNKVESINNSEIESDTELDDKIEEELSQLNNESIEEPIEEEEFVVNKEISETIGDKFQDNQKSLNDKIGGIKPDNSLGSKLQKEPISDLKSAIGLNEKFLFTKELFNDSPEEYQRAISKLNQMEDFKSAFEIMNSLKLRYKWNDHPEAYEMLVDLVNRRYIS